MAELGDACKVPAPWQSVNMSSWFVGSRLFLTLKHNLLGGPARSEHVWAMLLVQLIPQPASIHCLFSPGAQTGGPESPGSIQMVSDSRVVFPVEIM